ncbi:hypothetical protein ACTWP5_10825 [Streptomyces sp. 4N509B]|uniref:hypothetical protein n=1 Tax=Streptomyces sp. 4N509B TaxID=3457413 RepID=UPI003FCF9E4E
MDDRAAKRAGYPLTIPDTLLDSQAMRHACATRDYSEILRLVNRRTGSSYADIAAAIGKMTSSRVGDIIRGARGVRGQQVIERICDGFGIPGEMLGVPQRTWEFEPSPSSEERHSLAPVDTDDETGPDSATQEPDTFLVTAWIGGRRQLVAISRRELLAGAACVAIPQRASTATPANRPFSLNGTDRSRIDAIVDHLDDMWHALVKADNLLGPRHALASVRQQLTVIEPLLVASRGTQRTDVLRLAARYAESASWLYEDSVETEKAERWASQAMEWAVEANDQAMVTWTLFRRSQQATAAGNAAQTIGLSQAAQRNRAVLTGPMRAAAMQQEAHGYALDGEETSCHQRLDQAHEFAAPPNATGDARSGHGDFCTASYIEMRRGNCWLSLSRPDLAVPVLERALSDLPGVYQRDRAYAQARLAVAYMGTGEYDNATSWAASAYTTARGSGSVRTLHEVLATVNKLGTTCDSPAVSELFDAIQETPEF